MDVQPIKRYNLRDENTSDHRISAEHGVNEKWVTLIQDDRMGGQARVNVGLSALKTLLKLIGKEE